MADLPQSSRGRRPTMGGMFIGGLLLVVALRYLHQASGFVGVTAKRAQQESKVSCRGVDKKMKERIASVKKTGKLTDAMRLVAAAKVRRAQDGVAKSRPFSDELTGMIKGLVKKLKGSGLEAELPMLRVPEKVKNVAIMMITSDKGLCGAYNTFIIKRTLARIEELNSQGIVPKLVIVGRKGDGATRTRLKFSEFNYTESYFRMPNTITAKFAGEISEEIKNIFLSGEVDKVEVIYSKFVNLLSNTPTVRSMLPLTPTGIEDPEDETFQLTSQDGKFKVEKEKVKAAKATEIESDVIFDQPPETILNSMLPLYLTSQVLSLLYDAQASELSSRMSAMKAATDNAEELAASLTVIFNKKRQAAITQEISEIACAALALEGGDETLPLGFFDNEEIVEKDFAQELEDESIPDKPDLADVGERPKYTTLELNEKMEMYREERWD